METFLRSRSHLQSASYGTLSRIFSHCLDLSLKSSIPNLDASVCSLDDKNRTVNTIEDIGILECGDLGGKDEILQLVEESLQEENASAGFSSSVRLDDMISDFSLLIDADIGDIQSQKVQILSPIRELDAETNKNQQIEGLNERIINAPIAKSTEFDLGKEEISPVSKLDQLSEVHDSKDRSLGVENANIQNESHLQKLNHDFTVGDFEEGEITDEAQDLNEELEIENKDESLMNDESKKDLINNENYQDFNNEFDVHNNHDEFMVFDSDYNDENMHDEARKEGKKRKRVLTEERKAKKKKAKRIKRAKKLREEGVNRLRVPLAIKKEKEKKICKFFLNGRCQQGDKCKFSHDATPLTKSKPCNHFARGECLKGDQCPYDHDLLKYPCHKFNSEGVCNRGANCKFSHTIQAKEDLLSEKSKSNLAKDNCTGGEKVSSAKSSPVPKCTETPVKIPKGIKFLSFKKSPSASEKTRKPNDEYVVPDQEKPGLSNEEFCDSSSLQGEKVKNEAVCGEVSEASKILQEFLFSTLSLY